LYSHALHVNSCKTLSSSSQDGKQIRRIEVSSGGFMGQTPFRFARRLAHDRSLLGAARVGRSRAAGLLERSGLLLYLMLAPVAWADLSTLRCDSTIAPTAPDDQG